MIASLVSWCGRWVAALWVFLWVFLCGACVANAPAPIESPFRFVEDSARGAIDVFEGEVPVLTYLYGDQLPDGVPADRMRSSYVHPIYGLDGEVLTDDFPADHLHHRGLSMMWPRMKVAEQELQLWHIMGIRSYFQRWEAGSNDARHATLRVENAWIMDDGTTAAWETVTYRFVRADDRGRLIHVTYEIDVHDRPVTLQGAEVKGYGGLNLRFAPRTDTLITTNQGVAKDSDRACFAWADLSAKFGGREEMSGISILVESSHPDFPPPWTLRHYGDLNVAWPGLEPVVLEPDTCTVLPYWIWIHRGPVADGAPVTDVEEAVAIEALVDAGAMPCDS